MNRALKKLAACLLIPVLLAGQAVAFQPSTITNRIPQANPRINLEALAVPPPGSIRLGNKTLSSAARAQTSLPLSDATPAAVPPKVLGASNDDSRELAALKRYTAIDLLALGLGISRVKKIRQRQKTHAHLKDIYQFLFNTEYFGLVRRLEQNTPEPTLVEVDLRAAAMIEEATGIAEIKTWLIAAFGDEGDATKIAKSIMNRRSLARRRERRFTMDDLLDVRCENALKIKFGRYMYQRAKTAIEQPATLQEHAIPPVAAAPQVPEAESGLPELERFIHSVVTPMEQLAERLREEKSFEDVHRSLEEVVQKRLWEQFIGSRPIMHFVRTSMEIVLATFNKARLATEPMVPEDRESLIQSCADVIAELNKGLITFRHVAA